MLPIFAIGVVFGVVYAHTRSIMPSFVAHALFNLAQLVFVIPIFN
jgi:membrane protease YdiL (CAAX protease family)